MIHTFIVSAALCGMLSLPPGLPYAHTIERVACRLHVNPRLVAAVVSVESQFHRKIRTMEPDGRISRGLMQVKASTARDFGFSHPARMLYSPWLNVYYGNTAVRRAFLSGRLVLVSTTVEGTHENAR